MGVGNVHAPVRGIWAVLSCCLAALACNTGIPNPSPAPTASPAPTTSAQPSATPEPSPPSTPTVGPTTDTGLPTSILGLPVHTVVGINQLAASGALNGRFAAVAGFWTQQALPCAYMSHVSPVSGWCNGGTFGDTPAEAEGNGNVAPAPISVPETRGGDLLWEAERGAEGSPARVALIVHTADSRSWQCAPADRVGCATMLIIDRVAFINDEVPAPDAPDSNLSPRMNMDDVGAAAVEAGETLVFTYPLSATQLNEVDPRFIGKGSGVVWYVRVLSGAPDGDGVVAGRDVLVDDATGKVVAELPAAADPDYNPTRMVLDVSGQIQGQLGQAFFSISAREDVIADGTLSSSLTPIELMAGEYTLRAWAIGGAITSPPAAGDLACQRDVSLASGDDVSYYAEWNAASTCGWTEGSLFP
jgi:hypothetical protein